MSKPRASPITDFLDFWSILFLNDILQSNNMSERNLYAKAYFNWIRMEYEENPSKSVLPWQIEDYRELSTAHLFERLTELDLPLSEEQYLLKAENYPSPEQLTQFFCANQELKSPVYLILFELWRRLLPDKGTLSIFGDELDYRITLYFSDPESEHGIANLLPRLLEILEESAELGQTHSAVFAAISRYVAHDLEGFIYDYIFDLIDLRNDLEAADLLKTFYPYMADPMRFDFLQDRLLLLMDSHEGNLRFIQLLKQLTNHPDLDLVFEITACLIHHGDPELFHKFAQLALSRLETEEDLQELLAIIADYCHFVEKDDEEEEIQSRFSHRVKNNPAAALSNKDPDLIYLKKLLEDPKWSKI